MEKVITGTIARIKDAPQTPPSTNLHLEAQLAASLLTVKALEAHHPSIHANLTSLYRTGQALAAEHFLITLELSQR